jgi:hypothetical protein
MSQRVPQPLRRRLLEVLQDVVHAAHIDTRIRLCDRMRTSPALLVRGEPSALFRCQIVRGRHAFKIVSRSGAFQRGSETEPCRGL